MDSIQLKILDLLNSSEFITGHEIGMHLGMSRVAVQNRIQRLIAYGVRIDAVRNRGYKIAAPILLLEKSRVLSCMERNYIRVPEYLNILLESPSTNDDALKMPIKTGYALVASEYQTQGKGRRGRSWVQGFGSGLSFSIAADFNVELSSLSQLSLWAAVAVCEVLRELWDADFKVKWPNDIYADGKKVAGLLLEARVEAGTGVRLVIGIGLNVIYEHISSEDLGQPWTALSRFNAKAEIGRSELLALLYGRVVSNIDTGLSKEVSLTDIWQQYDYLYDTDVIVTTGKEALEGRYAGIDSKGNLRLETSTGFCSLNAGEVSVRKR